MELKTNSQIDISLNKEDLIDILVDEQLTKLENQKKELEEKLSKKHEEFTKVNDSHRRSFDKLLIKKHFPFPGFPVIVNYSQGFSSVSIEFYSINDVNYEGWKVTVRNVNTENPKMKTKEYLDFAKKYKSVTAELRQQISTINTEIDTIAKSPKRIKAKLLTNFLKGTEEGKEILKVIGSSNKKILALESSN